MADQLKLPRRAVLPAALLGASSLGALLSSEVKADQAFTGFAFNDSANPSGINPRTDPARWGDVFNVKSFGAVGNGVADDTAEIQAAMDAAFLAGMAASATFHGTTVFFPPGRYITSAPLNDASVPNAANAGISLVGSGPDCTTIDGGGITGGISGFTIDKNVIAGHRSTRSITALRHLTVINRSTTAGTGAVRMNYCVRNLVFDCLVQGMIGIDMSTDTFGNLIINTGGQGLGSPPPAGSIGVSMQQGSVFGGKWQNWENAFRVGGGDFILPSGPYQIGGAFGTAITGCAIEVCNTAILIGQDVFGTKSNATGVVVSAIQTEQCQVGIHVFNGAGISISGCILTGTVWVDATQLLTGIIVGGAGGNVTALHASGITVSMNTSNAKVDLSGATCRNTTFTSIYTGADAAIPGGGVAWKMPPTGFAKTPAGIEFINCDNPANVLPFGAMNNQINAVAANNIADPVEGQTFDISDLSATTSTPVIGATALSLTGVTWATVGAARAVPLGLICFDNVNLNVFIITTAGNTGSTQPTWNTTPGATTSEVPNGGTAVWTCLNPKSAYTTTGLHAQIRFNGSRWTVSAF